MVLATGVRHAGDPLLPILWKVLMVRLIDLHAVAVRVLEGRERRYYIDRVASYDNHLLCIKGT